MSHHQHHHLPPLTPQVEYNYIINWFEEFSEYEKKDFLKVLIEFLLNSETQNGVYMNGISNLSLEETKPMTLFQCRMKLFKEWTQKWNGELRTKLIDRINDLDSDFGLKLNQELEDIFKQDNIEPQQNFENGHLEDIAIN